MSEADTAAPDVDPKIARDRAMLQEAEAKGTGAKLGVFVKLSGPGWLQSAITLGGGSLAGALFLGVLGGVSMLWLQLVAIIMGVIMLSAISYVTLTTGKKPFQAINEHINPGLGWSWAIATMTANMLWAMPQFSLSFETLAQNLSGGAIPEKSLTARLVVSAILLALAIGVIILNARGGKAAKAFDWFLKALVGMVVICFFAVVVILTMNGKLDWGAIFSGFVPHLSQWSEPAGELTKVLEGVDAQARSMWSTIIVENQRAVMIGAAATAVGINMTFLLPYSMLNRGWDKTFRGLARFDLSTGMAIPYVLVTSCVVIAAASQFHGQFDPFLLGRPDAEFTQTIENDLNSGGLAELDADTRKSLVTTITAPSTKPIDKDAWLAVMKDAGVDAQHATALQSVLNDANRRRTAAAGLTKDFVGKQSARVIAELKKDKPAFKSLDAAQKAHDNHKKARLAELGEEAFKTAAETDPKLGPGPLDIKVAEGRAALPESELELAAMLVGRKTNHLSLSLAPLLGNDVSNWVFGIGVLGMGFSTIVILMLINGYVVCEILGKPQGGTTHIVGCVLAGVCGALWPLVWDGPAKMWLAITVSAFGMMLLPIAYTTFFFMLNSKGLMGKDKPTGGRLLTWNVLMGISVIGAFVAAGSAVYTKASHPVAGPVVWTVLGIFIVALVAGFFLKPKSASDWTD